MIADLRAIAVLAVLGLALLAALVLDPGRPAPVDRAVLPSFVPAQVRSLTWRAPDGGPGNTLALVRAGSGWQLAGDATADGVDAHAVEDVLAALRGARWHRRGDHAVKVRRSLTVELDHGHHQLEVGERLAGTAQAWLAVDGTALLVDAYVADLLDPDALAFRDRTPLAAAATATSIIVHGPHDLAIELHGPPWRTRDGLVDPALTSALVTALSRLTSASLAASAPATAPDYTLDLHELTGETLVVRAGGACPGTVSLVAVYASPGLPTCVDAAAWADVTAALAALARPAADIVDRRPAGVPLDHVVLVGATLSLVRRPMLALAGGTSRPADPDRAADLIGALAELGEPVAIPAAAPAFTLSLAPVTGDAIALDVFGDAIVHRRGETLALRITPAARAVLARPAAALLDAQRWSEDATTIRELVLDGRTYRRGAVIGEWTQTPPGGPATAGDAALVEALAAAAATVRAPARTGSTTIPAPSHRLAITFAPPVGAPVTYLLTLGPPSHDGCAATLAEEPVTAPLALCTAVAALGDGHPSHK